MKKLVVNSEQSGMRLDAYIASELKGLSRTTVKRLVEEENIKVNKFHIR